MKKTIILTIVALILLSLSACTNNTNNPSGQTEIPTSSSTKPVIDYPNVVDFEAALNNGEDLTGKTVTFKVNKFVPDSFFGYNLQTGEHLNFCSAGHPGVSEGDTVSVRVISVSSMMGSYIISYEIIK